MQRVQITTLQRGQLSVYCQDVGVTQRLVISRVDARHWELARSLWTGGKWVTQELIATYPTQAGALVQAWAWFARVALATATPPRRPAPSAGGPLGRSTWTACVPNAATRMRPPGMPRSAYARRETAALNLIFSRRI